MTKTTASSGIGLSQIPSCTEPRGPYSCLIPVAAFKLSCVRVRGTIACTQSCPRIHRNNPSERLMRIQGTNTRPARLSQRKEN